MNINSQYSSSQFSVGDLVTSNSQYCKEHQDNPLAIGKILGFDGPPPNLDGTRTLIWAWIDFGFEAGNQSIKINRLSRVYNGP